MTQSLHDSAQQGFSSSAELYATVRPNYPDTLSVWLKQQLMLSPQAHLLDLGAGTGKLIPELLKISSYLTAVEPIQAMRAQLEKRYPNIVSLEGISQAIPLADHSVDALFCAQAFHWFSDLESLQEIARVLKPQGHLILIWNQRDLTVDWVKALHDCIVPLEGDTPRYHSGQWQQVFKDTSLFQFRQQHVIDHPQTGLVKDVVSKRLLSTSFIAALPSHKQYNLKQKFESIIKQYTHKNIDDVIVFPYQTYIYHYQKI